MHNKTKILVTLWCCLLSPVITLAHSPDQISYIFEQDGQGGILTIHFTPQGAVDLITSLKPELADEPIIRLKNYYSEFTSYFNKTIDLKINGKHSKLIFIKGDLISHDAVLVYRLDGKPRFQGGFEISIASFTEIYQHAKNYVTVSLPNGDEKCALDKDNRTCSLNLSQYTSENQALSHTNINRGIQSGSIYFWMIGLLLILAGIVVFIYYKNLNP